MLQPGRQEQLHDDAENAQEDQIGPFGGVGGELEGDVGDEDERKRRHDGAPDGEEVDADERVCAFADPADGGVGACGAEDAEQGD